MTVGTYAFAQLLRALPRERITRAVGQLCDLELPQPVVDAAVAVYSKAYRVDLSEAATNGGYPSFDAFFTRQLRDGSRPLAESDVVSPADGKVDAQGPVCRDGRIIVKGRPYRAIDLLGSQAEAERYNGGQFAVVYLSPRDYHRVHAPVAGTLSEVRSFPGELFPVNSVSEQHIPGFLARNRRVAICIDNPAFGRVTVVMVAAMIVGRISVSGIDERDVPIGSFRPGLSIEQGDEIGIFHLGSTAVVFLEATTPGEHRLTMNCDAGPIQMGAPLASLSLGEGSGS